MSDTIHVFREDIRGKESKIKVHEPPKTEKVRMIHSIPDIGKTPDEIEGSDVEKITAHMNGVVSEMVEGGDTIADLLTFEELVDVYGDCWDVLFDE